MQARFLNSLRNTQRLGLQNFQMRFASKMHPPKITLEWMVLSMQVNESPMNAISSNPKPAEKRSLKEIFDLLDSQKTGSITTSDLARGFKQYCRIVVSEDVCTEIMNKTDLDKNGTIEINELEYLMENAEIDHLWKNHMA